MKPKQTFSKLIAAVMALAIIIGTIGFAAPAYAANPSDVRVQLDGRYVDFEGQQPFMQGGRVLVPVRGVFTQMGFEPTWNAPTAILYDGQTRVEITVGQHYFTINGQRRPLDVPAINVQGRVLIPLRHVAEALGGSADWDPVNRIAMITPPATGDAPLIGATVFPTARVGQAFSHNIQVTGTAPITWSVIIGNLPPGLSLNANTGQVTGTPTTTGTFNFTVHAQNAAGTDNWPMSITVEGGAGSAVTLPNRRVTTAERNTWIADYNTRGGASAFELEVIRLINVERAARNLTLVERDNGLMMAARFFAQQHYDLRGRHTGTHNFGPYATNANAATGASGNVATAFGANLRRNHGLFNASYTISAADVVVAWMNTTSHRNYILAPEQRFIGVGQFPGGITYLFLNDTATGTNQLTVTFRANGGTGTMEAQTFQRNVAQNLRANTFTRSGYTFAGWRTSATGAVQYNNNQSITITANRTLYAVWVRTPVITTAHSLPNAAVGVAYSQTLAATSGTAPPTWSITSGSLPPGLSLSNAGVISGTPTQPHIALPATYTFTVRASNIAGQDTRTFSIVLQAGNIQITPTTLPAGTVNVPYNPTLTTTGGTHAVPTTWTISASQPAGLNLGITGTGTGNNTAVITGTPTQAGTFSFTVWASNAAGSTSRTFTITVAAGTVAVPNVVNPTQPLANALSILNTAGFPASVVTQTTAHHPSVPVGHVISQHPLAGTLVPPGSSVSIVVSLGPDTVQSISMVSSPSSFPGTSQPFNPIITIHVVMVSGATRNISTGAPGLTFTNQGGIFPGPQTAYSIVVSYGGQTTSFIIDIN